MKKIISLMLLTGFIMMAFAVTKAFAQAPSVAPVVSAAPSVAAPVVVHPPGALGFVSLAGLLALMLGLNAVLSGVRKIVAYYDGIDEGQDGPPDFKVLNTLNKACYYVGVALDWVQGNVKH